MQTPPIRRKTGAQSEVFILGKIAQIALHEFLKSNFCIESCFAIRTSVLCALALHLHPVKTFPFYRIVSKCRFCALAEETENTIQSSSTFSKEIPSAFSKRPFA